VAMNAILADPPVESRILVAVSVAVSRPAFAAMHAARLECDSFPELPARREPTVAIPSLLCNRACSRTIGRRIREGLQRLGRVDRTQDLADFQTPNPLSSPGQNAPLTLASRCAGKHLHVRLNAEASA